MNSKFNYYAFAGILTLIIAYISLFIMINVLTYNVGKLNTQDIFFIDGFLPSVSFLLVFGSVCFLTFREVTKFDKENNFYKYLFLCLFKIITLFFVLISLIISVEALFNTYGELSKIAIISLSSYTIFYLIAKYITRKSHYPSIDLSYYSIIKFLSLLALAISLVLLFKLLLSFILIKSHLWIEDIKIVIYSLIFGISYFLSVKEIKKTDLTTIEESESKEVKKLFSLIFLFPFILIFVTTLALFGFGLGI